MISTAVMAGEESVSEVFSSAFYNAEIHSLADCPSNVWRLIDRSVQAHADLSHAHVLYVLKPASEEVHSNSDLRRIHPLHARSGLGALTIPWVFHVVLEKDGTIYDLDFHRAPRPMKTAEYFSQMFGRAEGRAIFLRVISAADYWRDYQAGSDDSVNWKAYAFDSQRLYPLMPLERFLSFEKY